MNPDYTIHFLARVFRFSLGSLCVSLVLTVFLFVYFQIPRIFLFRAHLNLRKGKERDRRIAFRENRMQEMAGGSNSKPPIEKHAGHAGRGENSFRFVITQDTVVVHTAEIVPDPGKETR